MRLDQLLVARGLSPTRSQARDLIVRGCVRVDGVIPRKAGLEVAGDASLEVAEGAQPYVSRGGLKLAAALDAFHFDPQGRIALDVGASTGGFVDVLLKRGAECVYAVDVGHGQLHPAIAASPRVVSMEAADIRTLVPGALPEVSAITADVSFISLTVALPGALAFARPGAWLVALVKPQFELDRAEIGKGGIVKSLEARERAVAKVRAWLSEQRDWTVVDLVQSPIAGGSGNIEYLIGALKNG